VWWNVKVFIGSGPTRIGSGLNGGDGGSGLGKGSPYKSKLPTHVPLISLRDVGMVLTMAGRG